MPPPSKRQRQAASSRQSRERAKEERRALSEENATLRESREALSRRVEELERAVGELREATGRGDMERERDGLRADLEAHRVFLRGVRELVVGGGERGQGGGGRGDTEVAQAQVMDLLRQSAGGGWTPVAFPESWLLPPPFEEFKLAVRFSQAGDRLDVRIDSLYGGMDMEDVAKMLWTTMSNNDVLRLFSVGVRVPVELQHDAGAFAMVNDNTKVLYCRAQAQAQADAAAMDQDYVMLASRRRLSTTPAGATTAATSTSRPSWVIAMSSSALRETVVPLVPGVSRVRSACLHGAVVFPDLPLSSNTTRVTGVLSIPDGLGTKVIPSIHAVVDRATGEAMPSFVDFCALFLGVLGARVMGEYFE